MLHTGLGGIASLGLVSGSEVDLATAAGKELTQPRACFTINTQSSENRDNYEEQINSTCDLMSSGDYSLVIDLTWGGWMAMKDMAENAGFPYVRVESSIAQFAQVSKSRVIIFQTFPHSVFFLQGCG